MIRFNVIAFTHSGIGINELGEFHVELEQSRLLMEDLKKKMQFSELMFLSTCNRVEFIFVNEQPVDLELVNKLIQNFQIGWTLDRVKDVAKKARFWNGINAVNHLIEVASSLDSMVLGEREIITQVRNAFNYSKKHNLSGDMIRIVIRQTIETAKKVYTNTSIAEKSVSVVALAYQGLQERNIPIDSKILIVGAGTTNQNMCKFLQTEGYSNLVVFNRTLENAKKFVSMFGGEAKPLSQLTNYKNGFDVIITCTGSKDPIITKEIYTSILDNNKKKVIIDLAIPTDVAKEVNTCFLTDYISVETLREKSKVNLMARKKELLKARQIIFEALEEFKSIFKMREIEIKMRAIPEHVKQIRMTAMTDIFSKEVDEMDEKSKEVLEKILNYMEKKYVSVPMIMAKEMLPNI